MIVPQQAEQYQQKLNPDQTSDNSYSRSQNNESNAYNNSPLLQHRSRQQQQGQTMGRVINRNYLQTQSNNYRAKTLDSRGSNDYILNGETSEIPLNNMKKKSISRSLKSLLSNSINSTKKIFSSNKRDKSYDIQNNETETYDTRSGIL